MFCVHRKIQSEKYHQSRKWDDQFPAYVWTLEQVSQAREHGKLERIRYSKRLLGLCQSKLASR